MNFNFSLQRKDVQEAHIADEDFKAKDPLLNITMIEDQWSRSYGRRSNQDVKIEDTLVEDPTN